MSWPRLIERGLEKKPETGEIVYRGENLVDDSILFQYPDQYRAQMDALYFFAEPVYPSGLPNTSKSKLFLERGVIPRHTFTPGKPATVQQMWDAQEDYWILRMLLTAINETNLAADNVTESAIREISYIELFGGDGTSTVIAAPVAGAEGESYMTDPLMGSGGVAATGPVVQFGNGQIAFDPAEEYGSPLLATAAMGDSGNYMDAAFGAAAPTGPTEHRYIAFDEANPGPYRERGFYIGVLIAEKKIPDLIVNLANLDPPVRTGRWAFANNPYDTDHLLKPARQLATGGAGGEYEYGGSGYGGGGAARPARRTRAASGEENYESDYGRGSTAPGFDSRDRAVQFTPAQMAEVEQLRPALEGKDLVQLELTGVVTIFTPEVPVAPPAEEPAATEAQPAAPADQPMPTEAATPEAALPATEGQPQPTADPGAAPIDPSAAVPTVPEGDATTPAAPETPPAATEPPATESPQAPPSPEAPPATESPAPEAGS
jgi:hypothetical protein